MENVQEQLTSDFHRALKLEIRSIEKFNFVKIYVKDNDRFSF